MAEINILIAQRNDLLKKISEIEESCEGIENENNAKRIQELNLEQASLNVQKKETTSKLNAIQSKITSVNEEIVKLSETGIDRILEAIKKQRWYFFKNKPKVLMDRDTGLLWANLEYFPYGKNENKDLYGTKEAQKIVKDYDFDGFSGFVIPDSNSFWELVKDRTFPFCDKNGNTWSIEYKNLWFVTNDMCLKTKDLRYKGNNPQGECGGFVLPCSVELRKKTKYKTNISPKNPIYTEKERLQFTLDLFVQNELWPSFDDDEITQLYKKIYFEKPALLEQLQELQTQIESLQTVVLLSSDFDYTALLAKYNMQAIDASIIKYYQAIQQWTDELLEKLDYYEQEKEDVIRDFNMIGLKLSKKYERNSKLTEQENELLEERQKYFQKKFSLGMNSVKSKILAVKKQANDLEYQIDEIDNSDNAIHDLAILEIEPRASFSLIAENTAKIIRNALLKIEYFEANRQYVEKSIGILEEWSKDYLEFKTTKKESLRNSCEKSGIEEEVWSIWYKDWQQIRYSIEQKVQPIIERGLKGNIVTIAADDAADDGDVIERIMYELKQYKASVDQVYLEKRKGIYQNSVNQGGGELQDKFETEDCLYRCVTEFQSALQKIIFQCRDAEDRIFILHWANSLMDNQIDEILEFVAGKGSEKISKVILEEFAELKKKNYDIYLADVKTYGEEKAKRERQYNDLIFQMRKGLKK